MSTNQRDNNTARRTATRVAAFLRRTASLSLNSWYGMTGREQRAAFLVLAIFVLGLIVRYWHNGR